MQQISLSPLLLIQVTGFYSHDLWDIGGISVGKQTFLHVAETTCGMSKLVAYACACRQQSGLPLGTEPPITMLDSIIFSWYACRQQFSMTLQAVHAAVAHELRAIMQHHK